MHLYIVGVRCPPETFIERKIRGLTEKGIEITICTPADGARPLGLSDHVHVVAFGGYRSINMLVRTALQLASKLLCHPRAVRKGWQLARARTTGQLQAFLTFLDIVPLIGHRPDLIHFEWNSAAASYSFLTDLLGCPFTVSCRGSQVQIAPHNPHRQMFVNGMTASFKHATVVHCVSEAIKQEALAYGLDPAKAWVIRPAVDPNFFSPAPAGQRADSTFRVVTTGALIWRKGYEYALLAVRWLVDQGIPVHFEIIGDGPEHQRVLYTIDDLDLRDYVQLLGRLTPEQVRDRLQQANAFLLSSLSEGISNAVLEAMACGLPVVTTDCGGMREAVTDGVEGFVVPVRDPAAMAEALRKLALNPELREAMGARARERILREFTLEQQTEQFVALYNSVSPTGA